MQSDNIQGPTEASFTFSATKFIYLWCFDFFGIPVSFMFSVSVQVDL
jgi:hypothetical protein